MEIDLRVKVCGKCKQEKLLAIDFYKKCTTKDGHQEWCKGCTKEAEKIWRIPRNRDKKILRSYRKVNLLCTVCGAKDILNNSVRCLDCREYSTNVDRKDKRKNPQKRLIRAARRRALEKGLPFTITENDIVIPTHCPILKIKLSYDSDMKSRGSSPSLDRILPNLGYIPGNVQIISYKANAMKQDMSLDDLILLGDWARARKDLNA